MMVIYLMNFLGLSLMRACLASPRCPPFYSFGAELLQGAMDFFRTAGSYIC